MTDYHSIFQPLLELFNQNQIQTIFLAWIPTKFKPYMTDNMAIDMFLTSVAATGLTALLAAICALVSSLATGRVWGSRQVTVQVEYYVTGTWGDQYASTIYEALAWLISKQTKQLEKGNFILQPNNDNDDDDECKPPGFHILPEKDENVRIEWEGKKFDINFTLPPADANNNNSNDSDYGDYRSNNAKPMPSIYLTALDRTCTDVGSISDFLNEVTREYLEGQRKNRVRSRYERQNSYWYRIQALSENRGLETVALSKPHEDLIKKELDTFTNDKDFYSRVGMPYRRGILLYGKPGTGKTSLINAISSHLNRDLYFLNLKTISEDSELSAAFSSVPANQIIVLEDVDAQSRVLHKRTRRDDSELDEKAIKDDKSKGYSTSTMISLSTFLGCLDGHIMSEGNIIIMTTNHVEHLDPAVIRPGRMDVQLNLAYCTHYQLRNMYRIVTERDDFPEEWLAKIPEDVLPPCEVMTTLMLWRNEPEAIPEKIYNLVEKYINGGCAKDDVDVKDVEDVKADKAESSSSGGDSKTTTDNESEEHAEADGEPTDKRTISTQTSMTITTANDDEPASTGSTNQTEVVTVDESATNTEKVVESQPIKEEPKSVEIDESSNKGKDNKKSRSKSKDNDDGSESDSTAVEESASEADMKIVQTVESPAAA